MHGKPKRKNIYYFFNNIKLSKQLHKKNYKTENIAQNENLIYIRSIRINSISFKSFDKIKVNSSKKVLEPHDLCNAKNYKNFKLYFLA